MPPEVAYRRLNKRSNVLLEVAKHLIPRHRVARRLTSLPPMRCKIIIQSTNPLVLATLLSGYANFHMLLTGNVDLSLQRRIYINPNSHQFKFESNSQQNENLKIRNLFNTMRPVCFVKARYTFFQLLDLKQRIGEPDLSRKFPRFRKCVARSIRNTRFFS